jgi:hypothetical protein
VHTTHDLTRCEEACDGSAVGREDGGVGRHFDAAHAVVEHRGDDGDVEVVVHGDGISCRMNQSPVQRRRCMP